jgi:hypothetical protein
MPVRIPAWQAKRPLHGALDKGRHLRRTTRRLGDGDNIFSLCRLRPSPTAVAYRGARVTPSRPAWWHRTTRAPGQYSLNHLAGWAPLAGCFDRLSWHKRNRFPYSTPPRRHRREGRARCARRRRVARRGASRRERPRVPRPSMLSRVVLVASAVNVSSVPVLPRPRVASGTGASSGRTARGSWDCSLPESNLTKRSPRGTLEGMVNPGDAARPAHCRNTGLARPARNAQRRNPSSWQLNLEMKRRQADLNRSKSMWHAWKTSNESN